MRYLRTNTATRITVGPFLDKTDGITPEVALTVTSEKLTLMVDTAGVPTLILDVAPTASGGANDMVHVTNDDAGFYDLELAAADVNYLGRAMLSLNAVATHCPVFHEFMILPAVIYDAMVLGTDLFDVSATQLAGQTITAGAGVTFPTSVASPTNITAGTITTATNLTTNNDKTGYGLSAAAVQAIWDALTSALTAAGSIGKKLADWVIGTSQTGDSFARLGAPAGASVSADVAAVKVDTAAILVDTGTTLDGRIPAALVSGRMDSSVGAMAANVFTAAAVATGAIDADALATDAVAEIAAGISGAGSVSTVITVNDGSNPLDGVHVWVTTDLAGANAVASGYTNTGGTVTLLLDVGSYYVWMQLSGYTFTNPQALTVT